MTNGEKFKTAEERRKAYNKYTLKNSSIIDEFSWLEFEFVEELKPCPFCGKVPSLKIISDPCAKPRYYYVACSCGATFTNADCKSDAVERWNSRVK